MTASKYAEIFYIFKSYSCVGQDIEYTRDMNVYLIICLV
jgi:hypothetical protein